MNLNEQKEFFEKAFKALTDYPPFNWQIRLFNMMVEGKIPDSVNIPTGLGKTNFIIVWLISLICSDKIMIPRRLIYIVNRRTVVDQATELVLKIRERITNKQNDVLQKVFEDLKNLSVNGNNCPLAISTLRGELADNNEWKEDPARPAIIIGTIDMIGSKLLFSGYGDGQYHRVHHAGLIGQDALIVHDEAHLTPAFSELLRFIEKEQRKEMRYSALASNVLRPIKIVELSATSRITSHNGENENFSLSIDKDDEISEVVYDRIHAKKLLKLEDHLNDVKDLVKAIVEKAITYKEKNCRVLIFLQNPKIAIKVYDLLRKKIKADEQNKCIEILTGTIRGLERDKLISESIVFKEFKSNPNRPLELGKSVYLISTSAGEVGVDLDADHLICDLTTLDSMIQRFGRVNRLGGNYREAEITVYPLIDDKNGLKRQIKYTENFLTKLQSINNCYDVSPFAISNNLKPNDVKSAFSPCPEIKNLTDVILDSLSLTTVDELPIRAKIPKFLHGVTNDAPETYIAWRKEVKLLDDANIGGRELTEWFQKCRIETHERLREITKRVEEELDKLLESHNGKDFRFILLNESGKAEWEKMSELENVQLEFCTVILPAEVGGLGEGGVLDGKIIKPINDIDVAEYKIKGGKTYRERWIYSSENNTYVPLLTNKEKKNIESNFDEIYEIILQGDDEDESGLKSLRLYMYRNNSAFENPENTRIIQELKEHLKNTKYYIARISEFLKLPENICYALNYAAEWHDRGKDRTIWQRFANNSKKDLILAKSNKYYNWQILEGYRHEFGSLIDAIRSDEINNSPEKDLILHLIASHHGWARPHFEPKTFDYEGTFDSILNKRMPFTTMENENLLADVMRRFGLLQQLYGRWGLAWLESILRCADAMASLHIPDKNIIENNANTNKTL